MATHLDVDYKFVEKLPEELTCSICMKVLCQPHLMNCCEQQYCSQCLEKWLKETNTCPHCRSTDFSHMLMKQQSRKIGELKVYCPNKKHGCESTVKISEYKDHLTSDKGCKYVELKCPNKCQLRVFRGELKEHTGKNCSRRQVFCVHCQLQGEHHFIVGEHEKKCLFYPEPCPQKCGDTIQRKDLETHRQICPLETVPCTYSELGCEVKVLRKDLEKHMETSALQHMASLAKSHLTLKAEHAALKQSHDAIARVIQTLPPKYIQVAQIQTLLSNTTDIEMNTPLFIGLCESNWKAGHHYFKLNKTTFTLEWEMDRDGEMDQDSKIEEESWPSFILLTLKVSGECRPFEVLISVAPCKERIKPPTSPVKKNKHDLPRSDKCYKIPRSMDYNKIADICCLDSTDDQIVGTTKNCFFMKNTLPLIGIIFLPHNRMQCKCHCHPSAI